MPPFLSLNFPLSQARHVVAPGVLDVPDGHSGQNSLGGVLPIVPAAHASNPDGAEALILDPSGTTTEEDPPLVTIDPAATGAHSDCSGSGCKCPKGHLSHSSLPSLLEILPGKQGMQEIVPVRLEALPTGQS